VNGQLQFRYDLGNDDHVLSLPDVNVSDGMRHIARVTRYGNQAILQLDSGEGRFYAERWPTDEHRALRLDFASGGGEVTRNEWTSEIETRAIIDSKFLGHVSWLAAEGWSRKNLHLVGRNQCILFPVTIFLSDVVTHTLLGWESIVSKIIEIYDL